MGIRHAKHVMLAHSNPDFERYYTSIKPKGKRVYSAQPMVYTPQYENYAEENASSSTFYERFKKIRDSHDFVVFSQMRHMWKNVIDDSYIKGNDMLIKGFAQFSGAVD